MLICCKIFGLFIVIFVVIVLFFFVVLVCELEVF